MTDELTRSMTEAQLQDTIVEALDLFGWLSFHDNDSRRNRAGFPDICAVHPRTGWLLFYELKSHRGKLRPAQEMWISALAAAGRKPGGARIVCREVRPDHLDQVLKEVEWYAHD